MKRVMMALLIFSLFLDAGCTKRAELSSGPKTFTSRLRFINAAPNSQGLSLYLDKDRITPNLDFKGFSMYRSVVAGKRTILIYPGDNTDTPILKTEHDLESGERYTAITVGLSDSTKLVVLKDDVFASSKSKAKVRFVNTMPDMDVSHVDFRETGSQKIVASGIAYQGATPYMNVTPGKHDFEVDIEGLNTSLAKATEVDIRGGSTYTIVAEGRLFEGITLDVYEDS